MTIRLRGGPFFFLHLTAMVAMPSSASAKLDDFVGTWVQPDQGSHSTKRIDIRRDGDRIYVRVWVRCTPTDCDWGEVEMHPYVKLTTDPIESADSGIAEYETGNIGRMVLVRPTVDHLEYQIFTTFADGANRNVDKFGALIRSVADPERKSPGRRTPPPRS